MEVPATSLLSAFAQPIHWHPPDEGITLVELFAGIGTGLAAVLEAGLKVRRYIHVDTGFVSNRAARHHLHNLLALYPEQLPSSAIHGCFGQLPRDVTLISDEDLRRLGHVDLLIAGWPCQGHSRAGAGRGLDDPRSSLFADLMRLTQWWFTHQAAPPGYIFENVPPLGDSRTKVLEDGQYINQLLGPPTFVDAASLGSYAHRPRWIWTNLAPSHVLSAALSRVQRPTGRKVDDILDDHRVALAVSKDDESPLALVNKLGAPRGALPTLVTYPGSFAFRARGPGMVWDSMSQTHEEPTADERERAMGFLTGTTSAHDLTEGQRRFLLGQAMDLNTLVWVFGICLAIQQHHDGHLLALRSESNGQGAVEPKLTEVEESELLFRLKWHATEELQAQRVFAALAQDFGKADAQEMFSRLFLQGTPCPIDTANSHTDCGGEAPHLASSEDAGGTGVVPSMD
ncbi:MAG TPA: DNA cytosine methyltransferase [Candidatus Obscuribacterales bacterium]